MIRNAKYIFLKIVACCLVLHSGLLFAQQTDPFLGSWQSEDKTDVMIIHVIGDAYYGRYEKLDKEKLKLIENRYILIQMKRKGNVLFGGTFYNIRRRTENEAKVRLINDSTFVLKEFSGIWRKRSKWHRTAN